MNQEVKLPVKGDGAMDIHMLTPSVIEDADAVERIVSAIEEIADNYEIDLSTAASRKAAKSQAYTIARSKTALDDAAKKLTSEWREATAKVNATRATIKGRLDAAADKIRQPVLAFEAAEEKRSAEINANIEDLRVALMNIPTNSIAIAAMRAGTYLELKEFDFQEQQEIANELLVSLDNNLDKAANTAKEAEEEAAKAKAQREKEQAEREELERKNAEQQEKVAAAEKEAEERLEMERQQKIATDLIEERLAKAAKVSADASINDIESALVHYIPNPETARLLPTDLQNAIIKEVGRLSNLQVLAKERERKEGSLRELAVIENSRVN